MKYALATIRRGGRPTPVIETDGQFYVLSDVAPDLAPAGSERGLMSLFDDWRTSDARLDEGAERAKGEARGRIEPPCDYDFMAPLLNPAKLLMGGANYYEHIRIEANKPDFTKETAMPVFFTKPVATCLVGAGAVRYPAQSIKFDWEIELAVVVGERLRRASEAEAEAAIAGYCIGIDFSARDWQFSPLNPFKFDLFTGKAFDDSCPLGPKFVPARFVDAQNLGLRLRVNGELMQNANTKDMVWSPAEQLAALSQHTTLQPGDILLTGTPSGVGMARGVFLKVGDSVEAEIDGLGALRVEIVPDADERPSLQ